MIYMFEVIHYYLQMYLRILEINALKYMSLILLIFCLHLDLIMLTYLKKTGIELELLTGVNLLLMVEKGTRGGIFNAIHRYA